MFVTNLSYSNNLDTPPIAMEIDIKPGGDGDAGSDDSPAGILYYSLFRCENNIVLCCTVFII